jgi:hypothetical protein
MDMTSPDARALIVRLDAWMALDGNAGEREPGSATEGVYDLEIELFQPDWDGPAAERLAQLDRLRKKVEVARKLYRFYLPDLSRPAGTQVLSAAAVRYLCALMLKAALVGHDARFLNSALKLLDGVLEREDCDFPDELRSLARGAFEVLVPPVPYAA